MSASGHHHEWADAFRKELEDVRSRDPEHAPTDQTLIGLAFSGGGIRSATFGLGVLEALKRYGILKPVHYLSTVSGGGYIGAWLSANCRRHVDWLAPTTDWKDSIGHLRRYSNYLSPKVGFFSADTWSMFTIWMRNTLLVQTTVTLLIACALLLPRLLFEGFQHWHDSGNLRWTTILLFLVGVVGIAGNQMRVSSHGGVPLLNAKSWPIGFAGGALCLAGALAYGLAVDFSPFASGAIDYWSAAPVALFLVFGGFLLQPFAVKIASLWPSKNPPQQINYTQGWVQAVVVAPMLGAGYLVAAILWGESTGASGVQSFSALDTYGALVTTAWKYWPFPLAVVFASLWLLSFCSVHSWRDWKGLMAAFAAPFVAVPVLHALLCAIMLLLHGWAQNPAEGAWKAFVWAPGLVLEAFSLTIVMLIGMMGRQSTEGVREWWSRFGAWLAIYGVAWMLIAVAAIYGPRWVDALIAFHPWTAMTAGGGWLGTVATGLFAGRSAATGSTSKKKPPRSKVMEIAAAVAPFVFIGGLLIGVSTALNQIVLINTNQDWSSIGAAAHLHLSSSAFLLVSAIMLTACFAALLVMAARVDINEFSLNAFYRNRLVRCYLGASRFRPGERNPQNFTGFDDQDDLKLAHLNRGAGAAAGPFHIVNCALNLGGSSDLALHTRQSAIFTLTPLFCGTSYASRSQSSTTHEIGYVETKTYGGFFGSPTLGQAIAVSGAAASPNSGYHTSPVIAFLLTVFNVRLGWWFPNPRRSGVKFPSPHFSLSYLFAELFGGATDTSKFLMISDGGHFENLAAYELIKRRCRVVIISDAECDPELKCEGLGTLIRMCEVDFCATITIDVSKIREGGDAAWSAARFAVGRIHYGTGIPDGVLIYLKAAMTGREDTSILQYKASHDTFPHETTGDQFYGEDQFESYRRLGREVALQAFASANGTADLVAAAEAMVVDSRE